MRNQTNMALMPDPVGDKDGNQDNQQEFPFVHHGVSSPPENRLLQHTDILGTVKTQITSQCHETHLDVPAYQRRCQWRLCRLIILKKAVTARPEQESPHLVTTVIG
jgi:hypothetical protein